MKKLLCMILALIMVLSLCACGQEKPNNDNNQTQGNVNDSQGNSENEEYDYSNEPPAEIWEKINRCDEIAAELKYYVENGSIQYNVDNDIFNAVTGQAALQLYYEELQELVAIEDWYHCEWSNGFDFISQHTCPQDMLDGFSVLENVLLNLDCNIVGHTGDAEPYKNAFVFSYNANGSIARVDWSNKLIDEFKPCDPVQYAFHSIVKSDWYGAEYVYDEKGVLTQVKVIGYVDNDGDYYHNGETKTHTLITLEHDAAGKLLNATATDYNGEKYVFEFTYDSQNRVSEIRRHYTNISKSVTTQLFSCAYDDSGKLVRLERTEYTTETDGTVKEDTVFYNHIRDLITNTYDAAGKLTASNYKWTASKNESIHYNREFSFTYDEQGRILAATQGEGELGSSTEYAKAEFQYIYGNCYTYTPVDQ